MQEGGYDGSVQQAEKLARAIALGRVAFGVACMVAPRRVTGAAGRRAEGQLVWMTRAFGVRDVVLGAGTAAALAGVVGEADRWVKMSAVADSLDIANAVVFGRELGRGGVLGTLALAVPAAAGGWWAAGEMKR